MNKRQVKKLLDQEKRQIEGEINQGKVKWMKVRPRRRLLPLMASLVLIISGLAFASTQMTLIEWFKRESGSYLDILEENPEYKLDMDISYKDIPIRITGFVTDLESNYLYIDLPAGYMIEDMIIENADQVYPLKSQEAFIETFYQQGMSSLLGTQQVYIYEGFDLKEGQVQFKIESLKDMNNRIYPVDINFDLAFKRDDGTRINLDLSKSLDLEEINQEARLLIKTITFLPTGTYLEYEADHDEALSLGLGDLTINNHVLSPFFFGYDPGKVRFYPIAYEDIGLLKWQLVNYSYKKSSHKRIILESNPHEFIYEGYPMVVEEYLKDDQYHYRIEDKGFKHRDFKYLYMSAYCGGVPIGHVGTNETVYVKEDGSLVENPDFSYTIEGDIENFKTRAYHVEAWDDQLSFLEEQGIDFHAQARVLKIDQVTYTYSVDEELILYKNIFKQVVNFFRK